MGGYGSGRKFKVIGSPGGPTPKFITTSDQAKMRRIVSAIKLLYRERISVKDLAKRLECSSRSATRLLHTIDVAGLDVECSMDYKYFLVKYDCCPVCGSENKKEVEEMRSGDA